MLQRFLLFAGFSLLISVSLYSQSNGTAADYIVKGDDAYAKFDNPAALNFYQQAFALDSASFEAAWKLSRAYVDVGEGLPDKEERKGYYLDGEKYARKAVEIDSMRSKGHLWISISLGRVALDAGAKERIRMSKEIKKEVDRALELDPNDDIAWHVLGRWNRKISTLSWIEKKFANMFLGGIPKEASVEKAAECFQKAIEIHPEHINHHLELGITYEDLERKDLAIQQYETALKLPLKDADDPGYKKIAEERLKKLQ